MELFDANKRLIEIHEMHETLLRVQAGTLSQAMLQVGRAEEDEPFTNNFQVTFVVGKPRRKGKKMV
jgi:hypothetical protein